MAVSLRGHAGSPGRLRTARLSDYVDDVVEAALGLGRPAVLVGHSMGGLVVQRALARYAAPAGVLVAPVSAQPAVYAYLRLLYRHPADPLLPPSGIRATARRYDAELVEFPGMGHDLMLDARWKQPLQTMLDWLGRSVT